MALSVTHTKVSAIADVGDATLVEPSDWNAAHTLTGVSSPAQGGTGVANNAASTLTISGNFGTTFTVAATTSLTLPASGTVATINSSVAFTSGAMTAPSLALTNDLSWSGSGSLMTGTGDLSLTGQSIGGTSSGTGFLMALGYNAVNNKQYWLGDPDYVGNSSGDFIRIISLSGAAQLSAVDGTNSFNRPVRIASSSALYVLSSNLGIGGETASFPALTNSGAELQVWLADYSGKANLMARSVRGFAVTFANVPTPIEGMMVAVTDSTTATWGATITGGGANHVLAYYNGTNWTVAAK